MLSRDTVMKFGALLASGFLAAATSAAAAEQDYRDVVRDERGGVVHDTDGDCVYTRWQSTGNECEELAAAPDGFLVFFDFDRSTLTAEAKSIIRQAAKAIMNDNSPAVEVVGHADRSGTDSYNMGLSKRRADAVKNMLVKLGVNKKRISTVARGERDPLVPTKDGVREPQNRRAEILY